MDVNEALGHARDTITVGRVFGEPLERNGVTVIPVAKVAGGGGGGGGHDDKGADGEGGGFGMTGRPAGAFVIRGEKVQWQPAVDPNRVVAVVGLVVAAYLLSRPRMVRARAWADARRAKA
jgi:uncharacterized spore protein YtfJ